MAFVEGRQILDVALIANEAVDSMLRGKECGLLSKLNIVKVYGHINWEFVLLVMKMGFGSRCASSANPIFDTMLNDQLS